MANEPGLGSSRTYQPGEMSLPTKLTLPSKRAREEEGVQTNETMQDLNGTIEELEKTRGKLDEMTKTMLSTEEERDM